MYPAPLHPPMQRPPQPYRPGPREAFRDVWLEFPEAGDLVRLYETRTAQKPIAAQSWCVMFCELPYRGRGLLTSAVAERWHRLGRCPVDYLWRAVTGSPFTPDGRASCLAAHAGAVRRAILDGAEVPPAVVASLAEGARIGAAMHAPELRIGGRYPMHPETLATLETAARATGLPALWALFEPRTVSRETD